MNSRFRPLALALALAALAGAAHPQCKVTKLFADAPQNFAKFGSSVAISGDRIVIGAPDTDVGGVTKGAAYVYVRGALGWQFEAQLVASDGAEFDDFGISVAIDGDTILVGADAIDSVQSGAEGGVYVFERLGTQWLQAQKLQASDGASGGFFGFSVAIEGDNAVIGRFWDSTAALHAGSAYLFHRTGSTWAQAQKFLPTHPAPEDNYGWAVAISGARILVGAPERFSAGDADEQRGRAFVYANNGTSWVLNGVLKASNSQLYDQFGISVAIDGDRIAVGAWQDFFFEPLSHNGEAFVFDWTGSAWAQSQILVAPDGAVQDEFGSAVALQGDALLVGAASRSSSFPLWGGVYAYHHSGATWTQTALILPDPNPSFSWFGNAIALDGNTAIAGAFIETHGPDQSGAAYVLGGLQPWTDAGSALAGTLGAPALVGTGTLCAGQPVALTLTNALPSSPALLIIGLSAANLPFKGGTLVPAPNILVGGLITNGAGALSIASSWPAGIPSATSLWFQEWIHDVGAPAGAAASNAVRGTTP